MFSDMISSKFQSFSDIEALVYRAFGSEPGQKQAGDSLLKAYSITPNKPLPYLQDALIQFITDIRLGVTTYLAQRTLSSTSQNTTSRAQRPSTVQAYRIKFCNPFPGPSKTRAHHCVDLLYLFDAFHADLATRSEDPKASRELVHRMQDRWIGFICDEVARSVDPDEVTVYETDGRAMAKNRKKDAEIIERDARFEVLLKNRDAAERVWDLILEGSSLDFH